MRLVDYPYVLVRFRSRVLPERKSCAEMIFGARAIASSPLLPRVNHILKGSSSFRLLQTRIEGSLNETEPPPSIDQCACTKLAACSLPLNTCAFCKEPF